MGPRDPRLIEIAILTEADRAAWVGNPFSYRHANPSGSEDWQRDEALLGLLFEGALVASAHFRPSAARTHPDPHPNPTFPIDYAASYAIDRYFARQEDLDLRITQRGRLRLYRLRDEILSRDRIRDDFGVLWAHRHWLSDLEVRLRSASKIGLSLFCCWMSIG